jgi:hypothetical protein
VRGAGPFVPERRHEWTAVVRPPPGHRLAAAVGTTFALDFTALTAVLLALLDQDVDRAAWDDQPRLLQAITRLGDHVRVAVDRSRIQVDANRSNDLFNLFDRMVNEVRNEAGYFHPKVWILKYVRREALDMRGTKSPGGSGQASEAVYRLVCTSRNLSLNASWEVFVALDGAIDPSADIASRTLGVDLAGFVEAVLGVADPPPLALRALARELREV